MAKKGGLDIDKTFLKPAFDYLVKNGLENASMRDLCKAMGVSSGSVYYWFDGKDDIYISAVQYGIGKVVENMFKIFIDNANSPNLFFDVFLDEVDKYKNEFRLAIQATASPIYGNSIREKAFKFKPIYNRYITMLCEEVNVKIEYMAPIIYMLISIITDYTVWEDREASEMQVASLHKMYKNIASNKEEQ